MVEGLNVDSLGHFLVSGALYYTAYSALRSYGKGPWEAGVIACLGVSALGVSKELGDFVLKTGTPDISDILSNESGIVFSLAFPYTDAFRNLIEYVQEGISGFARNK